MSELARRYAQALWQVSPDGEALERTARALMEEPALWEALCSPAVQAGEKGRVLARLPGLEEGGPLPHFYRLLAEKGRMALPWISRACAMTRASAGRWAGWAANWKRGEWHESKTGRDCLRPAGGDSEL